MSTQEAALLEAHRNKTNGQFGERLHERPDIELGSDNHTRLLAFAGEQDASAEGRRLANQARLTAAALTVHAELPDADIVKLSKSGDSYRVAKVMDIHGQPMGQDEKDKVLEVFQEAGVRFIPAPLHLGEIRAWTPEGETPTSPRLSPKGRTVSVTMPDGSVITRTSSTRHYTHAVVATPRKPEVVREQIRKYISDDEAMLAAIEEALRQETLTIREDHRNASPGPDGVLKHIAYTVPGPRRYLAFCQGTSDRVVTGYSDADSKWHSGTCTVEEALTHSLKADRKSLEDRLKAGREVVASIDDGTYDPGPWAAISFSGSEYNATKSANTDQKYIKDKTLSVVPVDG